jgi:uncharacterized protein (TIGR02285 family)
MPLMLTGFFTSLAMAENVPGMKTPQYWGKIFSWKDNRAQHPTEGIMFELLHEVTKQLPEYKHHYIAMSLSRGFTDLTHRDDLCMVGMMRNPERDKVGYFVGLWPVLPPQLVIRREDQKFIVRQQKHASLAELLKRDDLKGAILEGRYFGPTLEPLLQAAKAGGRLQTLQTSASANNLLSMLDAGRIDFTLDFLETFQTSSASRPELRKRLLLVPLEEAQTPGVGGIYCSRTPRGKQLIERIDTLAKNPTLQARFKRILDQSLPAKPRLPFAEWTNNYYQQRSQRSITNLHD